MEKYPRVKPHRARSISLSKNNFESSDSRDSQDVTEVGIFIINPSALSVAIAVSFTYNPLFSKVIEQMTDAHRKVRPVTYFQVLKLHICSCSLEISI